jgi:hypothetical protein
MRGQVTIRRVDKTTGETAVIYKDNNQTTVGFGQAMVNVLTGTGSRNVEDYGLRYFQLGDDQYDLSTFSVSADVTASSLVPKFWTIKSRLQASDYGNDSIMAVEEHSIYGLGSRLPFDNSVTFDNFVDPPDDTDMSYDYASKFDVLLPGDRGAAANPSSIWVAGCSNAWESDYNNHGYHPLSSVIDLDMSGPDGLGGVRRVGYVAAVEPPGSACLRPGTNYIYQEDGRQPTIWNSAKTNQTQSVYYAPTYYLSSDGGGTGTSGSTTITTAVQIFNRSGQALVHPNAAQNRAEFLHRYDLSLLEAADGLPVTYTPIVLSAFTGYEALQSASAAEVAAGNYTAGKWESIYGSATGGVVSANVYNKFGAIYSYADTTDACLAGPYKCFTGPGGGAHMETSAIGFGPSGNFYRCSISWNNVEDELINYNNGSVEGAVLQGMLYPMLSSLSAVDTSLNPSAGGYIGNDLDINSPSDRWDLPDQEERPNTYLSHFQFEYNPSASPHQYIHGERPYYVTQKEDFVVIPRSYTTRLVDNTVNVRLYLDEELANGNSIQEVGLFIKNPNGELVTDQPFLAAYKALEQPINKESDFSYIIDWELAVVDIDSD